MLKKVHWSKGIIRFLAALAILGVMGLLVTFVTGDFGIIQYWLNGVESRSLSKQSTRADRIGLQALYQTMLIGGKWHYPRATKFLAYYCSGQGDTLHFDANELLRNPEIQAALRSHKKAITFRHQPQRNPRLHVVQHTDWDLYYAFDLLFIERSLRRVILYDQYYFQPVSRRSRTPFSVGRIHFKLNDGMIHTAYPQAKMFIAYGEATIPTL